MDYAYPWTVTLLFIHFFNILKSACNTNNFIIQYYCYYILLELSILGFLSLGVTAEIITLFLMIIQIVIALKGEIPMCSNNKLVVYGAYGVVNLSILLKILVQARLGGSNPPRPDYYRLPFAIFFYIKRHQPALSRSTAMSSAHTANWNTLHLYHRAVPWKWRLRRQVLWMRDRRSGGFAWSRGWLWMSGLFSSISKQTPDK